DENQFTHYVNAHRGNRPDPSDSANFYEWNTKRRNQKTLPNGTPCNIATCQQIIDCLNNRINASSPPKFNPLFNNCRQQSKRAIGDCCLSQGNMTHKPPGGSRLLGRSTKDIRGGV